MRMMRMIVVLSAAMMCSAGGASQARQSVDTQPAGSRALLVGVNVDYPPYEFVNEVGEVAGFNVDILRAIAEELHLEVEFRPGRWSEIRAQLERGELDILSGMLYSAARAERVAYSQPFKSVRYSAFVRTGGRKVQKLEDLRNLSVIVEERSLIHETLIAAGMLENLIPVASEPEALRMLDQGDFDCAIVPLLLGRMIASKEELSNVQPTGPPLLLADLCFAMPHGRPELISALNDGLAIIQKSSRRHEIHDRWFGMIEPRPTRFGEVVKYGLWIIGPLLALLLGSLMWMRLLRREVAERTKQLSAELTERKRAEEALRRSDEVRRHTEEISLVMVAHVALGGQWLKVPPKLCELTGYTEQELLATTWMAVAHPADVAADSAQRERLIRGEGESFVLEQRYRRKDGGIVWVDTNCSVVKGEDGVPRYFLTYIRDISQRKAAEEALRTSEQRYRSLVSATTAVFWITDPNGHFVEPQESWELYTGQPWEIHKGAGWGNAIHPDELPRIAAEFAEVMRTGKHEGIFGRMWHAASASYRHFEAYGVPIRNEDGSIREWIGTLIDIEDRTRAQKALKQVESRFRQMAESSPDVFWFADVEPLRVRYVNPAFERIWGEPADAIYENSYLWQHRIHPEDRPMVGEAFSRFLAGGGSTGYAAEYRVVRRDGEVRWISDRGVSMQMEGSDLRSIAGIASDITERKEIERRQAFMMQELDHRVKNNLATVLSIAETTMAGSKSMEEFSEAFRGRILALARSHVALAEAHWSGVDLKRLVEQTILPYQNQAGATVHMEGEPLTLPPGAAAGISMTLNELCTNAVKHGALSSASGQVHVGWSREAGGAGESSNGKPGAERVVLTWAERGGPATRPPLKNGMGLALMRGLIGHELAGKIDFDFGQEGLTCTICFPLERTPTHPVLD